MTGRKIEIFDLLPEEAMKAIDSLGYKFLESRGYDTTRAAESKSQMTKLKKALRVNGEELRYAAAIEKETKAILIWFELYRGKERVATSEGIKFMPKPSEGGGNGSESGEERPATTPDNRV